MPNLKVDCLLCQEKPYESTLGNHLLRKHSKHLLSSEAQKEAMVCRLNRLDAGEISRFTQQLNVFRVKDTYYKICLVCKKLYCGDKGKDHYTKYPSCAEGAKEALRLFLNPPKKAVRVKKVATTDSKELQSLQKQIESFEKKDEEKDNMLTEAQDMNDEYEMLILKLFGSDSMAYVKDFIDDLDSRGKFKSYKELWEENRELLREQKLRQLEPEVS